MIRTSAYSARIANAFSRRNAAICYRSIYTEKTGISRARRSSLVIPRASEVMMIDRHFFSSTKNDAGSLRQGVTNRIDMQNSRTRMIRHNSSSAAGSKTGKSAKQTQQFRREKNGDQRKGNKNQRPDKAAIEEIVRHLSELQKMIGSLPDVLPPVWSLQMSGESPVEVIGSLHDILLDFPERQEIFEKTIYVVNKLLIPLLDQGVIQPKGKHRHEFSVIVERLLQLYRHCIPLLSEKPNGKMEIISVFNECRNLLRLLSSYGYEQSHTECYVSVMAAAREGRWVEAATIYEDHINPDKTGYLPIVEKEDIEAATVGLYAMARAAILMETRPVETVMDGVLKLTMVSPEDKDIYIFAAGTALGHAGEWKALLNYMETSYNAKDMGQPLVGAAMQACILNNQNEDALKLYDNLVNAHQMAGEWHWGGGKDRLHPACRDLAMRALGGILDTKDIFSDSNTPRDRALELFQQVLDDKSKISVDALVGVVRACENNGNWEDAVDVWMLILDKLQQPELEDTTFLMPGSDDFEIFREASSAAMIKHQTKDIVTAQKEQVVPELGFVLDHVMRACNASKNHGVALLCLRLFELCLPSYSQQPAQTDLLSTLQPSNSREDRGIPTVNSATSIICSMENMDDLLTTTMVSLCGVGSPNDAVELYKAIESLFPSNEKVDDENTMVSDDLNHFKEYDSQSAVYRFANTLKARQQARVLQPSWNVISRHVHQFTAAISAIEKSKNEIKKNDARLLSAVLGKIVRVCISDGQVETGLALAKWTEQRNLAVNGAETSSIVSALSPSRCFIRNAETESPLLLTDTLLSAMVEAFRENGELDVAEHLVDTYLGKRRSPKDWFMSYHEAIKVLFAQKREEDALGLFQHIIPDNRSPDLFCTVARGLMERKDWNGVADLYRLALSSGCMSEELSMLAMKSVVAGRTGNKMLILRNIVAETAKFVGASKADWIERKYWSLKRQLGEANARNLMGWSDPNISFLDELQLAIEVFEKRANEGLTPKTQVLQTIIECAARFEGGRLPQQITGLPLVPRSRDGWSKILLKVLDEAKYTWLLDDPKTIDAISRAFSRLECHEECVYFVNHAISRGVQVHRSALQDAIVAAKQAGLEESTYDIKMLAMDSSS